MGKDGHPSPVLREDGKMATWDTLTQARRETEVMPLASQYEIRILDLSDHL